MIKHHSQNIQNVILRELFTANQSIKIAVAWFTNDLLFQPLLLKLATGVKVDLILNKDEINLSSSIDFNLFVKSGGNLYWNDTNRLMHEKFCIIDDRVVITGSYNWTNKAESNYESISVFTNEEESLRDYKTRFATLSKGFTKQIIQITPQPVINRGKCPVSLPPYTKLKFYHSVNLFQSSNTPILAQEHKGGPYALLDRDTFLPKTAFIFSDYWSFIPRDNYLWVKGETRWGLFDCDELEYVLKPQFEKIESKSKNISYTHYILHKNGKYGVYILYSNNNVFYDCKYDNITYSENNGYPILDLQYGNNHKVFVLDSKIEVGGDNCNKITLDVQQDKNILLTHFANGQCGVYVFNDRKKLDHIYDKVICEDNLIYLEKDNKKGVYIIGHKKEFGCKYESIYFDQLEPHFEKGILRLQRKLNPSNSDSREHLVCYDIYVMDSKRELGGDWCVEVKYEYPKDWYATRKSEQSQLTNYTNKKAKYVTIVMKTINGTFRVYALNTLIMEECDEVDLGHFNIVLSRSESPQREIIYDINYDTNSITLQRSKWNGYKDPVVFPKIDKSVMEQIERERKKRQLYRDLAMTLGCLESEVDDRMRNTLNELKKKQR